ncbi:MAG: hypothetical protein COC01_09880 [Bacteroidetes bacterium]|nr:hypothetical protein [Bacteroidia bacterium]MBN4052121.1 hypothetical protein [Sphingobacteriaceae bacterium AH-315-L07]PCH65312.1 MAG: hypothetical protein COC01_09880 [Bacteroidota bacterium]
MRKLGVYFLIGLFSLCSLKSFAQNDQPVAKYVLDVGVYPISFLLGELPLFFGWKDLDKELYWLCIVGAIDQSLNKYGGPQILNDKSYITTYRPDNLYVGFITGLGFQKPLKHIKSQSLFFTGMIQHKYKEYINEEIRYFSDSKIYQETRSEQMNIYLVKLLLTKEDMIYKNIYLQTNFGLGYRYKRKNYKITDERVNGIESIDFETINGFSDYHIPTIQFSVAIIGRVKIL